jgi:hypothetical protein
MAKTQMQFFATHPLFGVIIELMYIFPSAPFLPASGVAQVSLSTRLETSPSRANLGEEILKLRENVRTTLKSSSENDAIETRIEI